MVNGILDQGVSVVLLVPSVKEYEYLPDQHDLIKPIKINIKDFTIYDIYKLIKKISPDIIIQRHFNGKWRLISLVSVFCGVRCFSFSMRPHLGSNFLFQKMKPFLRAIRLMPLRRITPVKYLNSKAKHSDPFTLFLKLPIEPYASINKRRYLVDGTNKLLIVGKLNQRRKNHLFLLKVLNKIVNHNENLKILLTIVGSIDEKSEHESGNYYSEIIEYISKSKLNNRVIIKKNIDYIEMKDIYLNNDVFILPSENEIFGQSVLESMAAGCVTVVSDDCGAASYIKSGKDGYVFKKNNIDDLVTVLTKILSNKKLMRSVGANSIRSIKIDNDSKQFCKNLFDFIGLNNKKVNR
jgi:glycosyltransferase involved in cell wall biosynthesis